jgi:Cytochrome c554 and c-prime
VFASARHPLSAGIIVLVFLGWWFAASGWGQQPNKSSEPGGAKGNQPVYYGASTCADCHSLDDPKKVRGLPPILCRCNEFPIWDKKDKHKLAYTNLFKPDGKGEQMRKLLGYSDQDVKTKCVVCHGVYIPEDKIAAWTDSSFKRDQSEGVSCVACHGADIGGDRSWIDQHGSAINRNRERWRKLSRQTKETDYGMIDLWDPARRAKKCASCHVGSVPEGKVVTHAMYAAGHPPLPGLEVSTFSDAMPRHWQYLAEKSDEAKKLLEYKPGVPERTDLLLVGGLVDLQEAMDLLASQAEHCARAKEAEDRSLDLAVFDCYACHHDLKTRSWRQERGYVGKPGRPQFRPWPTALLQICSLAAKQDAERTGPQPALENLHKAFDETPFGKPQQVALAARAIHKWTQDFQPRLAAAGQRLDRSALTGLLLEVCKLGASETWDYDSARQLAWAFQVIHADLRGNAADEPAVAETIKSLNKLLKLDLPHGQEQNIMSELPDALARIADYDPRLVKKHFQRLEELTGQR